MKLLLDQDVYAATGRFLKELGHDVLSAAEVGCSQASDLDLLATAQRERRILITRDRDFGRLIFMKTLGPGVIYLRISVSTLPAAHTELQRILDSYSEDQLRDAFVIVEPGRHRFRRLSR